MIYTTEEKVLDYVFKSGATQEVPENIDMWISAMSSLMDKICNRKLVADAIGSGDDGFEDKYFNGNGKSQLMIDDFISLDKVYMGDYNGDSLSQISSNDINTYPKISPFRGLVLKSGAFNLGIQNIKVSARWGYLSEVPSDLDFACMVLVGGVLINQIKGTQAKKSETIGNYSVSYMDDKGISDYNLANMILDKYKKIEI